MSTQRGNCSRTRAQKYKNCILFRNDLHDKTPQQKKLNSLHISEVCQHCKDVIEWKIKYKKYKPLSKPKTCTKCQQRKINKSYHNLCRECSYKLKVCAKCMKSSEEVEIEPTYPLPEEQQRLKTEMDHLIKSFSERKRRAFLRFMEKGKLENVNGGKNAEILSKRTPYTREELLEQIINLQGNDDDDLESDDSFNFDGSDDDKEDKI